MDHESWIPISFNANTCPFTLQLDLVQIILIYAQIDHWIWKFHFVQDAWRIFIEIFVIYLIDCVRF